MKTCFSCTHQPVCKAWAKIWSAVNEFFRIEGITPAPTLFIGKDVHHKVGEAVGESCYQYAENGGVENG